MQTTGLNTRFQILLTFLIFTVLSCVNRVDIPEEEEAKLFVKCEMLYNSVVTATLSTSNNLQGQHPILYPEDAKIKLEKVVSGVQENVVVLEYLEEENLYSSVLVPSNFFTQGATYSLFAEINNTTVRTINSKTIIPRQNSLDSVELLSSEIVTVDDSDFWQGTVKVYIGAEKSPLEPYYHVTLNEKKTILESLGVENEYSFESEKSALKLVKVEDGALAIRDIVHRDGFLIDHSDLEEDHFTVTLRSTIPIETENQVTHHIFGDILSVSKSHYDYHTSISNIEESQATIFDEPALLRSNINDGLGVFSGCILNRSEFNLVQ